MECPDYLDLCERPLEEVGEEFTELATTYLMAMGYLSESHPSLVATVAMRMIGMSLADYCTWETWDKVQMLTATRLEERAHAA